AGAGYGRRARGGLAPACRRGRVAADAVALRASVAATRLCARACFALARPALARGARGGGHAGRAGHHRGDPDLDGARDAPALRRVDGAGLLARALAGGVGRSESAPDAAAV